MIGIVLVVQRYPEGQIPLCNSQHDFPRNTSSEYTTFLLSAVLATLKDDMPAILILLLFEGREEVDEDGAKETAFPYDVRDGGFLPRNPLSRGIGM